MKYKSKYTPNQVNPIATMMDLLLRAVKANRMGVNYFFNNASIRSLSSRGLSHRSPIAMATGNTRSINYLRSNTHILKSSLFMNPFKAHTKTSIVQQVRNMSFRRYNQYRFSGLGYSLKKLKRPTIFTILFCAGTTLIIPFLFDNTPLSYLKRNPQVLIWGLLAINGAVYLAWKVPSLNRYTMKYGIIFKDHLQSTGAMIGSAFSHQHIAHLALNMLALYSFGSTLINYIGATQFTLLYLNAAAISSLASIAIPTLVRGPLAVASLGASGSVFAVFAAFSFFFPNAGISFFFFPVPGGAWTLFLGTSIWNTAGCILRWGTYDYAAHLGGSFVGVIYAFWLKRKRDRELRKRMSWFR